MPSESPGSIRTPNTASLEHPKPNSCDNENMNSICHDKTSAPVLLSTVDYHNTNGSKTSAINVGNPQQKNGNVMGQDGINSKNLASNVKSESSPKAGSEINKSPITAVDTSTRNKRQLFSKKRSSSSTGFAPKPPLPKTKTGGWVGGSNGTQSQTNLKRQRPANVGQNDKAKSPVVQARAKSTNGIPSKPQTRTMKPNSMTPVSTVYKTQSDTSLVRNMKNLSLGQNSAKSTTSGPRSRSSSSSKTCKSLDDVANVILNNQVQNVVVMVGAGISTSSGIPDFRSPGTGLYDNLKQYRIPYPEAIFDVDYFERSPKPFYTLAKELYPGKYLPNYVHYFLRLLHEKGILMRVYTQNIDGLEKMAGIPAVKLVEAHGTFETASCTKCKCSQDPDKTKTAIFDDKFPRCMKNGCLGLIKPDIVFFGEDLPRRFYYYLKDMPQADLLLVMGTSLEVEPFAGIVDSVRFYIPRVLFNRNAVGPFRRKVRVNDVVAKGDLLQEVRKFAVALGWHDELIERIREWKTYIPQDPRRKPELATSSTTELTTDQDKANNTQTQATGGTKPQDNSTSQKNTMTDTPNSVKNPTSQNKRTTKTEMFGKSANGMLLTRPQNKPGLKPPTSTNVKTNPSSVQSEVRLIRNMMKCNSNENITKLPHLKQTTRRTPFPAFHAQTKLYRTTNDKAPDPNYFRRRVEVPSDSSSSEELDSSEDDD